MIKDTRSVKRASGSPKICGPPWAMTGWVRASSRAARLASETRSSPITAAWADACTRWAARPATSSSPRRSRATARCWSGWRRTSLLVRRNAAPIRQLLARYDGLVARARQRPGRAVLTHGEPHPGNTMLTPGGWVLIDWDTALVAQPERDLWLIDPGDGTMLDAYASATGVSPMPDLVEAAPLGHRRHRR